MTKFLRNYRTLRKRCRGNLFSFYTSILGVFLCIGCFAGTTWAWFNTSTAVESQTFKAANSAIEALDVEINVWDTTAQVVDEEGTVITPGGRSSKFNPHAYDVVKHVAKFNATEGTLYKVNYLMGGTAKSQLLMVETPDGNYYTEAKNSTFNIILASGGTVRIYASWGANTGNATEFSKDIPKIGFGTEDKPDIPIIVQISEKTEDDASSSSASTDGAVATGDSGDSGGSGGSSSGLALSLASSSDSGSVPSSSPSSDSGSASSSAPSADSGSTPSSAPSADSGSASSSAPSADSGSASSSAPSADSGSISSSAPSTDSGSASSSAPSTDSGSASSSAPSAGSSSGGASSGGSSSGGASE